MINPFKYFKIKAAKKEILDRIVSEEMKLIDAVCNSAANSMTAYSAKSTKLKNSTCPHCACTDIVKKFANVSGSSSGSGEWLLGAGSYSSSGSISTQRVLHCRECGNEWEPTNSYYYDAEYIRKDIVQHLAWALESADESNHWTRSYINRRTDKFSVLNSVHMETIFALVNSLQDNYYTNKFFEAYNDNSMKKIFTELFTCEFIDYDTELEKLGLK